MAKTLRIAALILALGVFGVWLASGRNMAWTKTSVPHVQKDPVTEIEYTVDEKKFVPGVDFLACGFFLSLTLGIASFFFRRKLQTQNSIP